MYRWLWIALAAFGFAAGCSLDEAEYYTVDVTDYREPPPREDLKLADDKLADKNPAFDETLVDTRPLTSNEDQSEWEVNQSAAVIRLDCPMMKPDDDAWLLELRPTYADAMRAAEEHYETLLPSANLLDGAAKQFDDGLYAAVDLACYRGELGPGISPADWVAAVLERLPTSSPARPFLAAALELAGRGVELSAEEIARKDALLAAFEGNEVLSKPISFYTWTPELQQVWRFFRFLQQTFPETDLAVPQGIADVLKSDAELLAQYQELVAFYSRLTNPAICLPVDALIAGDGNLDKLAGERGVQRPVVAILPPSTSREAELFNRLFPQGIPDGTSAMVELIRRIRSGEVNLAPGESDGWYQHQVFALETLLSPEKGAENQKLLLTAEYKKRLIEAFKALMTKRRETHSLAVSEPASVEIARPNRVYPRLRIEPCATFYLRTARAYAFLESFLQAAAGERLEKLHGLRAGGQREPNLAEELAAIRQRFYGFFLVACDDIGLRPDLRPDEPVDAPAAMAAALAWLDGAAGDPDLACDTRVAVPIYVDPFSRPPRTRLWATLGVRLARLDTSYARGPRIRPKGQDGPWQEVDPYELTDSRYVIAVDEFAEFERTGLSTLTRDELRKICDEQKTREKILQSLASP